MKKSAKRSKRSLLVITAGILLFLAVAVSVGLMSRPDIKYLVTSGIKSIGNDVTFQGSEAPESYVKMSLQELEESEKVTFDQSLMLINTQYPLSKDFSADIGNYGDTDVQMNSAVISAYSKLKTAVNEETGDSLYINDAYRSEKEQAAAIEENGDTAQELGSSEHQAGLALDVYVKNFAGYGFIKSEAGQFVNSFSYKSGFIIRYPSGGKNKTGIDFEPWHIRYVGFPHAEIITRNSLTLEEYIENMKIGDFYEYDGYVISRQSGDSFTVPEHFRYMTVSPDNTGNYILTARI